ncbi:hypothetical protein [Nocardia sp. NPDC057668]|uniref:hypothetical protein n=1 Tax=Nocardia sp. NPDC057668 TaxID=3346202 RepID=UPI00366F6AFD
MKRVGPIMTLAAAVALGAGLLITNTVTGRAPESTMAAPSSTTIAGVTASPDAPSSVVASSTAVFPAQADYIAVIATPRTPITLSVTVSGDKSVAYACDGVSVETWLRGTADKGRTSLAGKETRVEAELIGATLRGTLTLGGRDYDFTAAPVKPPAGLYISRTDAGRDSWIRAADGTVTGVRRTPDGSTVPAPELPATARKVQGSDTDF